ARGTAEGEGMERGRGDRNANDRKVSAGVGPDHGGRNGRSVAERDLDILAAGDHVRVGQDVTLGIEHDSRADGLTSAQVHRERHHPGQVLLVDARRRARRGRAGRCLRRRQRGSSRRACGSLTDQGGRRGTRASTTCDGEGGERDEEPPPKAFGRWRRRRRRRYLWLWPVVEVLISDHLTFTSDLLI